MGLRDRTNSIIDQRPHVITDACAEEKNELDESWRLPQRQDHTTVDRLDFSNVIQIISHPCFPSYPSVIDKAYFKYKRETFVLR